MLYGATPFPHDTAAHDRPAAGDDAALGDHRRAGARGRRQRRLRRRRTRAARAAPRRRGRLRLRRRLSAPRAATARRCSSAARRARLAGRVSMDMLAVDLSDVPEAARRQPGGAVGRRVAGRRSRRRVPAPSATNCCARSRRACRSWSPTSASRISSVDVVAPRERHGDRRVHRRDRRRRIHRLQPGQGAQRPRRDAASSPSTTSRAPTSSATSSTARSPTTSTRTNSSPAWPTATSTTTSRRSCTRARAPTPWRPTAAT